MYLHDLHWRCCRSLLLQPCSSRLCCHHGCCGCGACGQSAAASPSKEPRSVISQLLQHRPLQAGRKERYMGTEYGGDAKQFLVDKTRLDVVVAR